MKSLCRSLAFLAFLAGAIAVSPALADPLPGALETDSLPSYLRDRGTGVYTSLFGTYVREGELLVYPFYEYVENREDEYHGSELGGSGETDYFGEVEEHEVLLFLGYGITEDLAIELEGALWTEKTFRKSADDFESGLPDEMTESGVGDVESQLRWRLLRETEDTPELYANFEVVFPLQPNHTLIGTQDWEYVAGIGLVKGFSWGTITPRISVAYDAGSDSPFEFGEYAIEYLKKINNHFRWVSTVEGSEDEVSLVLEAQWHFSRHAYAKFNSGFGLTEKAEDVAPEIGVMMSF